MSTHSSAKSSPKDGYRVVRIFDVQQKQRRLYIQYWVFMSFVVVASFLSWSFQANIVGYWHVRPTSGAQLQETHSYQQNDTISPSTLVLYNLLAGDQFYMDNFKFFVRHGVEVDKDCYYRISMTDEDDEKTSAIDLPKLPQNAEYVTVSPRCQNDFASWLAASIKQSDRQNFKYFIWLDSTLRGPFLPTYLQTKLKWSTAFTKKLNSKEKLVGCSIKCGYLVVENGIKQRAPQIEHTLGATDAVGLTLLLENDMFQCSKSIKSRYQDYGMVFSDYFVRQGYNIDCLMQRYQGVDWRDRENHRCNQMLSPLSDFANDGLTVHPYELMFYQVESDMFDAVNKLGMRQALKLSEWADLKYGSSDRLKEMALQKQNNELLPILEMNVTVNGECLDWEYIEKFLGPGEKEVIETIDRVAWFKGSALQEGRPYRYKC